MEKTNRPDWLKLFESILVEPGRIGDHYRAFHNYSLGNQALAVEQLAGRGIQISPIASFNAWKAKGRKVMKGQKAIGLWMPVTLKQKDVRTGIRCQGRKRDDAANFRDAKQLVRLLANRN